MWGICNLYRTPINGRGIEQQPLGPILEFDGRIIETRCSVNRKYDILQSCKLDLSIHVTVPLDPTDIQTYCSHYSQRLCFERKRSRSHITLMLARKQRKWFLQDVAVYSRSGLVDRAFVVSLGLNVQEATGYFQFNQLAMVCRGVDSYLPLLSVSSHSQNVVQLILTMWWRTSPYIIVHTTENHCIICVLLLPEYSEVKPSKHESPATASGSGLSTNHRKYADQVK